MKSLLIFFQLLVLFAAGFARAATVDTLAVFSTTMDRTVPVIVVLPDAATPEKPVPVVYLLHGYGGNETSWLKIKPSLPAIADREGIAFVCPGVGNSWYLDSTVRAGSLYETFMIRELLPYIEDGYPVCTERTSRAITGLSMGGCGAMSLAIKHKEVFGAVGSTSGGLDIRPFARNWELPELLGNRDADPEAWERITPINLIPMLADGELAIVIDCGYADFFFDVNNDFHAELFRHGIMHDYYVRPGEHNNTYWRVSIDYQILFFSNFFAQNR